MEADNTRQWVLPAISLGYSVCQDRDGRLRFWMDHVEIIYRDALWIAVDGIDPDRRYGSLKDALVEET